MRKQIFIFTLIIIACIIAGISTKDKKYPANYYFIMNGANDSLFRCPPDSAAMYVVTNQRSLDSIAASEARDRAFFSETYIGKNKFNKDTMVVEGYYIQNSTGVITANANSRMSSLIPVLPNTTYTASGEIDRGMAKRFSDATRTYISYEYTIDDYTFTTPANCYFVEVNLAINKTFSGLTTQIEQGIEATSYESYRTGQKIKDNIKISKLNGSYILNEGSTDSSVVSIKWINDRYNKKDGVVAVINGDSLLLRCKFDDTNDLLWVLSVFDTTETYSNNSFNFNSIYTIPNDNGNSLVSIFANKVLLHSMTDDVAPFQFSNSYMGANHGLSFAVALNSTSHGLTNAKIGTEYKDWSGRKYYPIRIIDADSLWVLSENTGTEEKWVFDNSISGNLYGTVSLDSVIILSKVSAQLKPQIKNHTKKVYLFSENEILTDGTYYSDNVTVREVYDIINPATQLDSIISNSGSEANFKLGKSNIYISNEYSFDKWGGCLIKANTLNPNYLVDVDYFGYIQTIRPYSYGAFSGATFDSLFLQVPNTKAISGINFSYLTPYMDYPLLTTYNFTSTYWNDANNPPYRSNYYLGHSRDSLQIAYGIGYISDIGINEKSLRKNNLSIAWQLNSNGKIYPRSLDNTYGDIAKTTMTESYCYKNYKPVGYYSQNASAVYFFNVGKSYYVVIEYNKAVVFDKITLPDELNGLSITNYDIHATTTVHSTIVTNNNIYISSSGTTGYAVLKLE